MTGLLARVAETISRYNMFPAGSRAGVAVSGGADSVFLLHALHELGARWSLRLEVLHVNHGLRAEESDADERFVAALAARFGLPFRCARASPGPGNLEQEARLARLRFFASLGLDRIATGHTRSDQAETVLFRFLRGSGSAGIAAIWPLTGEGLARPLLGLGRDEIRDCLARHRIAWREDRSNLDPRFARNRVRGELLPLLRERWNPEIESVLAAMAAVARDEERYWEEWLARSQALRTDGEGVILGVADLIEPAPARRLIREALRRVRGDLRRIDSAHVECVLALAGRRDGRGRVRLPGAEVVRSFDLLRLGPPRPGPPGFEIPVSVPGRHCFPAGPERKSSELVLDYGCHPAAGCLDLDHLPAGLVLRNWRPGDRYQPAGRAQPESIKLMFQRARIPLWERAGWPVLAMGGAIVWSRRFGAAAGFAASAGTRRVLCVRETDPAGRQPGT